MCMWPIMEITVCKSLTAAATSSQSGDPTYSRRTILSSRWHSCGFVRNVYVAVTWDGLAITVSKSLTAAATSSQSGVPRVQPTGNSYSPEDIAVDRLEMCTWSIVTITVSKSLTAAATSSQSGDSNGTADGQFNNPQGIAVDSSGNVYVADTGQSPCPKV